MLVWMLAAVSSAEAKPPRPLPITEAQLPDLGAQEFRFGPGDRLSITVHRHEDLDSELTVAPDGTVTVPLLGRLTVAGHSYTDLVDTLQTGWSAYYTDVSVAVNVTEVTNRKVFVVGEVAAPSVLQVTGELSMLEALVHAGGINPDARTSNLLLVRGEASATELYEVDVDALLAGDLRHNVPLKPGDIVVVPTRTIVNVERFFRRVSGILSPFVSATQIYRNVNLIGQPVIEDGAPEGGQ